MYRPLREEFIHGLFEAIVKICYEICCCKLAFILHNCCQCDRFKLQGAARLMTKHPAPEVTASLLFIFIHIITSTGEIFHIRGVEQKSLCLSFVRHILWFMQILAVANLSDMKCINNQQFWTLGKFHVCIHYKVQVGTLPLFMLLWGEMSIALLCHFNSVKAHRAAFVGKWNVDRILYLFWLLGFCFNKKKKGIKNWFDSLEWLWKLRKGKLFLFWSSLLKTEWRYKVVDQKKKKDITELPRAINFLLDSWPDKVILLKTSHENETMKKKKVSP